MRKSDQRLLTSAVLAGRPGHIFGSEAFDSSNVIMAPARFNYEGNWLFCMFSQPEVTAARIGFGRGKMDWRDYGLENAPISGNALFCRIEVVAAGGIHAYVLSDAASGQAVESKTDTLDVRFYDGGVELFHLTGWPSSHWYFRNPQDTVEVDLTVEVKNLVVWPDFLMPRNTFGMCVGTSGIAGHIRLENRRIPVAGAAFYDHPRIVLQTNPVAPFGWYLYAPIRFTDGTLVASYYSEDGLGRKDEAYSAGFLTLPDGSCHWLQSCQVRKLRVDEDGLPVSWESELEGAGVAIRYRVEIVPVPLVRGWGGADPAQGKYVAYPLLMAVEGECVIGSRANVLTGGRGIAEFLVRTGYELSYP